MAPSTASAVPAYPGRRRRPDRRRTRHHDPHPNKPRNSSAASEGSTDLHSGARLPQRAAVLACTTARCRAQYQADKHTPLPKFHGQDAGLRAVWLHRPAVPRRLRAGLQYARQAPASRWRSPTPTSPSRSTVTPASTRCVTAIGDGVVAGRCWLLSVLSGLQSRYRPRKA